ncbi:hypothetical protein AVEN_119062-1 [Araneus ventricosus]|uniref:Uncharacterized protein n=1 Tax=Araneus ventricosus TaxID=182803 RepID=A0A4Y2BKB5_ARAVE|nr:hypothetical protein AVEN_119062-1 [Araneus ventricosus]
MDGRRGVELKSESPIDCIVSWPISSSNASWRARFLGNFVDVLGSSGLQKGEVDLWWIGIELHSFHPIRSHAFRTIFGRVTEDVGKNNLVFGVCIDCGLY